MKRITLKRVLAIAMVAALMLSFPMVVNADDEVITLKLSGTVNEEHLSTKSERFFAERVDELSGGRLKIEVYPNNQLGDPRSMLEATIMGNNDIVECGLSIFSGFTNQLKFFTLPFLWANRDAAYAFLETDAGKEVLSKVEEEMGVHVMCFMDDGFFNVTTNKEIHSPEDVKGFKIRCQESDVLLQIWKDLGASPLPMSFTEVYTALQQGAIEGQMNGYVTNYTSGYYEVQKYIIKLGLLFSAGPICINADAYNALPDDLREIFDQAAREMQEYNLEAARSYNQECADGWVEHGGQIIDLTGDLEPWKEATKPTYDWFRETFPEVDLDTILEAANELNEQYADATADEVI